MGPRARKTSAIGEVISKVLQQAGAQHDVLSRTQEVWVAVVGKELATHSRPVNVRRGVLYVHTDESGTGYLLGLRKRELAQHVGVAIGSPIADVVIRAGTIR